MNSIETKFLQYVKRGYFSVDDDGRIWRHRIHRKQGNRHLTWLALSEPRRAETEAGDYLAVQMELWGKKHIVLAHRAVYLVKVGAIPDGYVVNHKDESGDKHYNHPSNLEAVTPRDNTLHAKDILKVGPWHSPRPHYGSRIRRLYARTKAQAHAKAIEHVDKHDAGRGLLTRVWLNGDEWVAGIYLPG